MSRPPVARDRVLDALEEVLIERGLSGLTLDLVAERAGVSKGGLLYHFPSKARLLDGLFDRHLQLVQQEILDAPDDPAEVVRWFIRTSTPPSVDDVPLFRSLTALLRSSDDLETDRLKQIFDAYAAPVRAALRDPVLIENVRLVGDGLFMSRLFGLSEPDAAVVEQLADALAAQVTP